MCSDHLLRPVQFTSILSLRHLLLLILPPIQIGNTPFLSILIGDNANVVVSFGRFEILVILIFDAIWRCLPRRNIHGRLWPLLFFGIDVIHELFVELQTVLGDEVHESLEFAATLSGHPLEHLLVLCFDILKQNIVALLDIHGPTGNRLFDRLELKDFLLSFNIFLLHLEIRRHLVLLLLLFLRRIVHFLLLFLLLFGSQLFGVLSIAARLILVHFVYFF